MRTFLLYSSSIAGLILPFFNIPLLLKIRKTRNVEGISLIWTIGVLICLVFMLPQAILSPDLSFKIFGISNFILFSIVAIFIFRYRKK